MFKLVYDPRYELIKTTCYTDLVIADPDYPKKILLASLAGDDSSVKAIAAAIIEHRELHLLTLDGRTEAWLRSEGKHRLLVSKTPEGHAHALVLSRRAMPGEGDVLLCWDGDLAGALGKWLLAATDLPLLPDWLPRLWAAAEAWGMIRDLDVWAEKDAPVTAFRVAQDPERWEGLLSELVRDGEIELPDGGGDSPAEVGSGKLDDYLVAWGSHLAARAQAGHQPLFEYAAGSQRHPAIAGLAKPLFEPQADVVEGLARVLERQSAAMLVGEMGTGKTRCGAAIAHRLYAGRPGYRVLVMAPKHLQRKWPREVKAIIPEAKTTVLRTCADVGALAALRHTAPDGPEWYFIARDTAKLGWFWRRAAIWREPVIRLEPRGKGEPPDERVLRPGGWHCPDCWALQEDEDGTPWGRGAMDAMRASNARCAKCGSSLWEADRSKVRRFAPAFFIHRHLKGFFDLLVADEVHEMKGGDTAQGIALGTIAAACGKVATLTGTLLGGYARDAFYLLWRLFPEGMLAEDLDYRKPSAWIDRYGVVDRIYRDASPDAEMNAMSRGGGRGRCVVREQPGVSPLVFSRHLLDRCAFLDLADVAPWLPAYREIPDPVPLGEELEGAYKYVERELLSAVRQMLATGSRRLLGAYLQTLMGYPDRPWEWPDVVDHVTGDVVVSPPQLPEGCTYPKEQRLLDLVKEATDRGRKVAVYVTFTGRHDMLGRLESLLGRAGYRVAVLRRDTVKIEDREAWIEEQVRAGAQVLITHPKLVETGLDLIAFPTIVWFQTGYSLYVLRQASRRSFRIGQTAPVEIRFLGYEGTMQSAALLLMARKLDAAQALEGRLSSEGLRALAAGADATVALARMLCDGMGELRTAEAAWRAAATLELASGDGPAAGQTISDLIRYGRVPEQEGKVGQHRVGAGQLMLDLTA